ncbi:MAG TPA: pyruvate formate lyase family protein, partial [Bacteroidales bacterium]|nr:pyruvate formate lyase family protein [Bacteroidales bacterium]
MTDRVRRLREQSLNAIPAISPERAQLVTEFYKSGIAEKVSVPVVRAMLFEHILKNKSICINEGELIVGERGPAPKATPTYPEINLHSMEDLEILDTREKVWFRVDEETKKIYREEIIPFWKGKSNRERIMRSMEPEWLEAYKAGVFTEFQEQRAPGHTVLGKKIYSYGMVDLIEQIRKEAAGIKVQSGKEEAGIIREKLEELKAMEIAANAIILFANRYADELEMRNAKRGTRDANPETEMLAEICRRVPAHAPRTFHEALQYYWFMHLGVVIEMNPWDSFNPGRLDQHLYPFYKKEMEEGTLTKERARELLQSFWIKFNNHPSPPKVGVTAQESNTYTDFALINLGGVTEEGEDAVNEL